MITSTPSPGRDENRRKILSVPEGEILGLLRDIDHRPAYLHFPSFDLPEGVKVCGVYPNYAARSFDFVLEHESFEPVEEGLMAPRITVGHVTVKVGIQEGGQP